MLGGQEMLKKINKKIMAIFMILLILFGYIPKNISTAATFGDSAKLQSVGACNRNVQFKFSVGWSDIKCDYIAYVENGTKYPAYCVLHGYDGIEAAGSYSVELTKILDDDRLYRVIVNGFPYKSASALGVEDDYDAFMATKQAVNCVMLDRDVRALYKGKNTAGNKVVDAIEKLVNIGRNGTQTFKDAQVSINKVGSLKEEGNFYTQEYSVSSDIQMSKYIITSTKNMPTNSYIANTNLSGQTTFNAGNNFKVVIPKSSLTSNLDIKIGIQTKCKTYPVFFGKTTKSNTQNYAVTMDPYGDYSKTISLAANINTGSIKVTKLDADNSAPIQGVVFQLLKADGTQVATATTDANGIATFSNLYPGNYKLREISTVDNYILNSQVFDVSVEYNKTTTQTVTNYYKKGSLKIIKTDSDISVPVQGVTFQLTNSSGSVVATGTTDTNGELYFDNLRVGNYKLKETSTNINYVLNSTVFDVNIEYNKTTTKNITNDYKKGNIKINKTDSETSKGIEGVTFQLYKADGSVVATSTTNSNGEAYFNNIRIGSYKLKEISTNNNYVINTATFDVTVEYNKTITKEITNEHKRGNLIINKVDKDNHRIALGNVIFDLYSEEFKRVIGTYTTDVNGEITINNLRTGDYKLIERNTGKWYNLAEDTNISITWNETTNTMVENELKKGSIQVIKVDKDNNEVKIPGVVFQVLDENNTILETIVTNSEGIATTNRYPIRDYSKLKLREIRTDKYYVLNTEIKTIELKANEISNITFENEKKKGQIKVIKVDLDNNEIVIPNVEFNVYDESGNIVDTLVTDEKGEAISKKLPIDQEYTVKENKTNELYVLNDEPQTVTLEYNQITDLTFTNEKKKGQIEVIKVDKDNNELFLEGVTFEILDEQENVVDTITTDSNGKAISKRLPIDQKYTLRETITKNEYVLSEEIQTVELKENEISSLIFENEKIKGYLEITKIDSNTKSPLKDTVFGIYDSNNNLVQEITTDIDGKATSNLLPIGKYYVKELKTGSPYFLLNEKTYEFEIIKNHETVPLVIENDATDIKVNVDKKGSTEVKPSEVVDYTFSNVANESNVYLDNFKWIDYIPTAYIRLEKMTTGTWKQDLKYKVLYRTNKSQDYIVFKDNLSTKENYSLDFTSLELAEDEFITETCFDFGTVDLGFKELINPTMQCRALKDLLDGQTFTNYTKTVGTYFEVTANAESNWTTIVHIPEKPKELLPRTGYFK